MSTASAAPPGVRDAPLRVAVVGAGVMGADHASTLQRFVSGARVRAVADVDRSRAERVAAGLPGCEAAPDAHRMVVDPEVDAVVIASSDATHAEFVRLAASAGKPVMCEKPLAPSLEECRRLVEDVSADGLPLVSVGFMRRFDPGYARLRDDVASGAVGPPLLVHCVSRGVSSAPGATTESAITGSAIHELDLVPWLLGSPVVEVRWQAPRTTSLAPGLQDPQVITLRTADAVLTVVEVFLNARYGYDVRCEVVGETGAVTVAEPVTVVTDAGGARSTSYAQDWRPRFADAYRLELQAWVDAVVAGTPSPLATVAEAVTASAVADAVIASMRNGGRPTRVQAPALPSGRELR